MHWLEIRQNYPQQWLLVEALNATTASTKRILDQLAVVDSFGDSTEAMKRYVELHRESPEREYYVLHTSREDLDISERRWMGVRPTACLG